MRRIALVAFAALFLSPLLLAKDVKIHGFVTNVVSPTNFEIDDYRIMRDVGLQLEIEKDDSGEALASFKPEDVRVGTELEIKGEYDEKTGELKAKSIKVYLDDTRKVKRTALLEKSPVLTKENTTWKGQLFADGQKVVVDEKTLVTQKRNKAEHKQAKENKESTTDQGPLESADKLTLDTWVHYEGSRQPDGSILASKVEFKQAELEPGEAKMWKSLTPKVKDPNYSSFKSGELKVAGGKFKLFPNKEAQEYISTLGASLIPQHQRDLSGSDPLKIPFKFYLIEDKSFNAFACPNGVVVVHTGVFAALENEAQLAFVLSHEITHSIEKHTWQQHEYHKKALMAVQIGGMIGAAYGGRGVSDLTNMVVSGIRNGYSRSLENQADRVGLEWMLASGYDIREAPRSWKVVSLKQGGDRATNFFWDSHDNNTTRRSYLMAEIRNNYSDLDYSKLRTNSENFDKISTIVKEGRGKKEKVKVKVK